MAEKDKPYTVLFGRPSYGTVLKMVAGTAWRSPSSLWQGQVALTVRYGWPSLLRFAAFQLPK
jgi:hypothetical protein